MVNTSMKVDILEIIQDQDMIDESLRDQSFDHYGMGRHHNLKSISKIKKD